MDIYTFVPLNRGMNTVISCYFEDAIIAPMRSVYRTLINTEGSGKQSGKIWSSTSLRLLLISGDVGCQRVSVQQVDILNTACK